MSLRVIVDDRGALPERLRELVGVDRFGQLIFKRRTLATILEQASLAAGLEAPLVLRNSGDWNEFVRKARNEGRSEDRYLVCPVQIVSSRDHESLVMFLKQARYSPQNLVLPVPGGADSSGWALMTGPMFILYVRARTDGDVDTFFEQNRNQFVRLDERMDLIDLGDEVTLLEFLSGTFEARSFNAVESEAYTITKKSSDKSKLEREYRYYEMLPPAMQAYFIRPFDFADQGDTVSYRMERLFVPDMAIQWIHGALTEAEFRRFLDHLFNFVSNRAVRPSQNGEAEAAVDALFVTKVRERVEAFKKMAEYGRLRLLIEHACGSLDALVERYLDVFGRMRRQLPVRAVAIGHGDLCFSNILYAKTSQTLKLIDPRGAAIESDLWTHPYYDVAKLSHSIQGSYDFVNQGMFEIRIDTALRLQLVIDRTPPDWAAPMFVKKLQDADLSPDLVRLCEASLFISMLPLHADRPRKVLGFILVAIGILDELEGKA